MAWTVEDVEKLKRAIANGVRKVKYRDKEIEYQSTAQMREALASIRREVEGLQDKRKAGGIGTYNPTHHKGL